MLFVVYTKAPEGDTPECFCVRYPDQISADKDIEVHEGEGYKVLIIVQGRQRNRESLRD